MFRPLRGYQVAVDVGIAVAFFLIATVGLPRVFAVVWWSGLDAGGGSVQAIGVTAMLSVALGMRRWSPGLALAVCWAAAIAQMLAGLLPLPGDLAIFGVLYTTAAYGSRPVFWAGLASTVAGAVAITGYLIVPAFGSFGSLTSDDLTTVLTLFASATLALLLSWTVGALVRTAIRAAENRRAKEVAEAASAAEAERGRIARDMHDVVAHSLAVVIAQADGARYAAAADPQASAAALTTISSTARAALSDVRVLLTQLRHSQADGPQPTLGDLEQVYAQVRASGVDLRVDIDPAPATDPPAAVHLAVYRILQEALTNALRHGAGGAVEVGQAWHADRVDLLVRNVVGDPGRGPGPGGTDPGRGHGLVGMRERAQLVGGTFSATVEGEVFTVRATLPLGPRDAQR